MTNADRIRAMNDEEIAQFCRDSLRCPPGKGIAENCPAFYTCKECWYDWLNQEADHDN